MTMRERAREDEREGDGDCDGEEEERSASQIRRKESRFTVESKEFEIAVEDRRGKIQGCIVEKKGGASSWVRLGAESLTFFLEGLNLCIKGEKEIRWGREWKEQGRLYSMIRGTNRARGFIRLGVSDVEGKRFCIFVPRGRRDKKGWTIMAEKLKQVLGFFGKNPEKYKGKVVEKVAMGGSYATMRAGEMDRGGEDDIEKWGKFWAKSWDLKGNLGLAKLNKRKALLEFEDLEEARRVVSSGSCAWEGTQVRLEHWSPRSGCWAEGEERRDVWVRIVGLPISLWSPEILRRVGDACGGFITVDENTRSMRDLQWARILVKWGGEAKPNVLEIEGEEESYVVSLWWECWPVLRRKCRDEVDRQSREVRGEEDPRAGQRVMKGWGSGRLEMLHPSDDGTVLQGAAQSRAKETRREGGPSLLFGSMDLKNKGVTACTTRKGSKALAVQEVTGLSLKGSAHSHSPEAEFFAARENEDTRKLTRRGEADSDGQGA
ncbi:hypothetical protein CK203_076157 [Vitis vinifera]|uniref:DUF4283 domain-containing protein n=1 Tax=Vitis vinifera TaxID=29760 RepID=A0A438EE61_VITVI|nr:hypothetical protein CK203_076157 [Vitis vinifera]